MSKCHIVGSCRCVTHNDTVPALCTHAVQVLQRERDTLRQTIEAVQAHRKSAPHGDCACQVCSLTRERDALQRRVEELSCRDITIELHEPQCPMITSHLEADCDCLQSRLASLEAQNAVLRKWVEDWLDTPFFETRAEWEKWVPGMRQRAHAALSPRAGEEVQT